MSATEETCLELRPVGQLDGHFLVPAYQRGFRWGPTEVDLLLSDILENGDRNYCLQPVVVRRREDHTFELVDGQQRLTTVYLILSYLRNEGLKRIELPFRLTYETRARSEEYLKSIDADRRYENIDFFHMHAAYQTIRAWFERYQVNQRQLMADKLFAYLHERVQVIWYEADASVDPVALFTRLNIGRIPLTNAELIRALLLARPKSAVTDDASAKDLHRKQQLEMAGQWDLIEHDLHGDVLWAFLSNQPGSEYPTRIELIFELMAIGKPSADPFHEFLHFKDRLAKSSATDVWQQVLECYHLLKEWFDDRDLYHRVGYLIWTGEHLADLVAKARGSTKSSFRVTLDEMISESIDLSSDDVRSLGYDDGAKCRRLLVLFNIETMRTLGHSLERYPFHAHKQQGWTLEHIHAQSAETLNKKEQWQEWLAFHRAALAEMNFLDSGKEAARIQLLIRIDATYAEVEKAGFEALAREVAEILSADSREELHGLSNLALLTGAQNTALSNSVFEVKRRKIIEMDRAGHYIPICTRRAFLKYYAETGAGQLHFWSDADRAGYLDAMISPDSGVLSRYLRQPEASEA